MERLKGGGVGAKRVMMATQGEGLGSGFLFFVFVFWKGKKGEEEKKKGEDGEIEVVKWERSEVGHLFLQSCKYNCAVFDFFPEFSKFLFCSVL